MGLRQAALWLILGVSLACVPVAAAKDFRPGDLRLCGMKGCVAVVDQAALDSVSTFYYGDGRPARIARPALNVSYYELRFRNAYVTGIVATGRLNRFLSYGVNTGRFARGTWYRVPAPVAAALRAAAAPLPPLRLTAAALRKSR
jgi:hypothetical protein